MLDLKLSLSVTMPLYKPKLDFVKRFAAKKRFGLDILWLIVVARTLPPRQANSFSPMSAKELIL